MHKKIGIVTIIDNDNYGNRLQNYAVQQSLKKLNYDVETCLNVPYLNTKKYFLLRKIKYFRYKGTFSSKVKRRNAFKKFNSLINFSKKNITPYSKMNKYDYVIVGSDQVWNPTFGRLREVDLLANVSPKKRIAFSASFGISDLPENVKKLASNELNKFSSISVRENDGKNIIQKLTTRKNVEVLVDPTMLLNGEEWDKVAVIPKQLDDIKKSKYILNYFLGELSEERKKEIDKVAIENDCHVINILDKNDPFYETGPSEFLYLEKNAFLICTDSFHSSVFSIIYNTPFIVFGREGNGQNMNSRIDTLLTKFKLTDRKYNGKITDDLLKHDYSEAYKILEEERKKSEKFLKNALDIEE